MASLRGVLARDGGSIRYRYGVGCFLIVYVFLGVEKEDDPVVRTHDHLAPNSLSVQRQ